MASSWFEARTADREKTPALEKRKKTLELGWEITGNPILFEEDDETASILEVPVPAMEVAREAIVVVVVGF